MAQGLSALQLKLNVAAQFWSQGLEVSSIKKGSKKRQRARLAASAACLKENEED